MLLLLPIQCSSEGRAEKLWIPEDSPYIKNKAWLDSNFPRNTRPQFALFESATGDILTPEALGKVRAFASDSAKCCVFRRCCWLANNHVVHGQ